MMKKLHRSVITTIIAVVCLAMTLALFACGGEEQKPSKPAANPPVSVKVAESDSIQVGSQKNYTISNYITARGNAVTHSVSDSALLSASIAGGVLTIGALQQGEATVTITCTGDGVTVTTVFTITCTAAQATTYTVTVDGVADSATYEQGAEYTLPQAPTSQDANMEFDYWAVQGDQTQYAAQAKITITGNTVITAQFKRKAAQVVAATGELAVEVGTDQTINIADYITAYGAQVNVASSDSAVAEATQSEGVITVSPKAAGACTITISCGEAQSVITITSTVPDAGAPKFNAVTLSIDLIEKTAVTHEIAPATVPDGKTFTYAYSTANAAVTFSENTLTYTSDGTKAKDTFTVTVTATPNDGEVKTVTFNVTVNISDTRPKAKESALTRTDVLDMYNCTQKLDLAANITNAASVTSYSVAVDGGEAVAVAGTEYDLVSLKNLAAAITQKSITLTIKANYGTDKFVQYTYALGIIDSTAYQVKNGGFEAGNLTDWTVTGEQIAVVTDNVNYWNNTGNVYGKDGNYLLSWFTNSDGVSREGNIGIIKSAPFKLRANAIVTFKLGAALNNFTGIKFVKADGTVLAQFYNTNKNAKEGVLVEYVYTFDNAQDLDGVYVVVFNAEKDDSYGGWRCIAVDSINTYVTQAPSTAVAAQNVYADKSELKALVATLPTAQGDYTESSYNAVVVAKNNAQAAIDKDYASAAKIAELKTALQTAKDALAFRVPTEVSAAEKTIKIAKSGSKEITLAHYVNEDGLSKITYTVTVAQDAAVTVGSVANGKFTITAGATTGEADVTIKVLYDAAEKLTVTLSVGVVDATDPTLKTAETVAREKTVDLYDAQNKTNIEIDFSRHIDNPAGVSLTYEVTKAIGAAAESISVGSSGAYTLTYGNYTYEYITYTFAVTVKYTGVLDNQPKELDTFNYVLKVRDTRAYRIQNGGFEKGNLDGWTMTGNIGAVSNATTYWDGILYKKDGEYFFMGNEDKASNNIGSLASPTFTVGGSGYITYRFGSAGHFTHQYIEVIDTSNSQVLARLFNQNHADCGNFGTLKDQNAQSEQTLLPYKVDLTAHIGKIVQLRVVDKWEGGGCGFVRFDDLVTYYETAESVPAEYVLATNYLYNVYNGGFEKGNLDGWTVTGDIGHVSNANGYWGTANGEIPFRKDGTFFFHGNEKTGNPEQETDGTAVGTVFTLGGSGFITFRIGVAKNKNQTNIEIVDAATGEVVGRYGNTHFADNGNYDDTRTGTADNKISALTLYKYKADLSAHIGKQLYIRVVDHCTGDYRFRFISVDDFVTYYADATVISDVELATHIAA